MYCKKLIVKKSNIQGLGVYAGENIKKGEIIMIWIIAANTTDESTYIKKQLSGDKIMIKTGSRYIDNIYLYTDNKPRIENYINHSFNPNVLYHCGICFALSDIQKGDELSVNYEHILSADDEPFIDIKSNRQVIGMRNKECLIDTTKKLLEIIDEPYYLKIHQNE